MNIAYSAQARRALGPTLREAARRRIAYREVSEEELGRMAGSLAPRRRVHAGARAEDAELSRAVARTTPRGLIVALDHVGNPHNAGAILRTAAFFGARGLVIGGGAREALAPSALRVAEGGAEHVPILHSEDLTAALKGLRALGLTIVGADSSAKQTTPNWSGPRAACSCSATSAKGYRRPHASCATSRVRIAGSGAIDSLNVSVAAGVLMAGYAGVHGPR